MALQVGSAIGDGVRRAFTYSGGVLMALLFAYMVVFTGATNALFLELLPPEAREGGQLGLVLPVPPAVGGAIVILGLLFGVVLYLVATRALTRDQAALSTLPSELSPGGSSGQPSRRSAPISSSSWPLRSGSFCWSSPVSSWR